MRTLRHAVVMGLGVLAAGCPEGRLRRVLPPDVRVDTYAQEGASKIDVLWVVDNSGSMAPRQENLAKNFDAFLREFVRAEVDFRLAVTSTDVFTHAGALLGNPWVLTPTTSQLPLAFARNIKVGTSGSPYEAGLQAAELALQGQAKANASKDAALALCAKGCGSGAALAECRAACITAQGYEFLRPDAYLYLVFVSDEEDRSVSDVRYYYRAFETVKGIGNDATVTTAAIMGDVPSNTCGATPGRRYAELVSLSGGETGSICDDSFAQSLKKLATNAVGLRRKFALTRKPNPSTLEVRIRYPCNAVPETLAACASVEREGCVGQPLDAVQLVCVPPRDEIQGWSYEPKLQVVYFAGDSVPLVHAEVDLQYYEEGANPQ